MKKIIFILLIFTFSLFIVSCKANPNKISDANEFDLLFSGAIKYDIRSEEECENGHIPSFMCMGALDKDEVIHNIDLVSLDKKQNIILIGNEEDILYIFQKLAKKGFKNMYYFEGGYDGYVNAKGEGFNPETGCGC